MVSDTRTQIERIISIFCLVISIALPVLHFTGQLHKLLPNLSQADIQEILLLLLGLMFTSVLFIGNKLDTMTEIVSKLSSQVEMLFNSFVEKGDFGEIALSHILRTNSYGKFLKEKRVIISGRNRIESIANVNKFWQQCLMSCSQWYVVSYISLQAWFDRYGNQLSNAIQAETCQNRKVPIVRIFVVDSENEIKNEKFFEEVVQAQKDIGIKVKWITRENLESHDDIKDFVDRIETMDFAIADIPWVITLHLRDNRLADRAVLIEDHNLYHEAREVFLAVSAYASEFVQNNA
jgi:hypothetical protein